MVVKRYSNDEIIKKVEEIKKDIEITSKIIDKKLINIQEENIKSKGRSIGYAMLTVAAVSLTAFIALKDLIFLYSFFVIITISIILILYYNKRL